MKIASAALAVLFLAIPALADSNYTITLNVLAESPTAPSPTFGIGTLDGTSVQYGDGYTMDFTFTPDTGAAPEGAGIDDFFLADTGPIYFCDGCNPPAPGSSLIPQLPGSTVFYFPANGPSGQPVGDEILYAFAPIPDYYVFGTLSFTDPVPAPEPATYAMLIAGIAGLLAFFRLAQKLQV